MGKEMVVIDKNPVIIKNKNFRSIVIRVCFPYETKFEDVIMASLLPNLLIKVNNKYKNEDEFMKEMMKRHIITLSCDVVKINASTMLYVYMTIPSPKYFDENVIDPAIQLLADTIYNPYITNKAFNKKIFDKELERLKQKIENHDKHIEGYSFNRIYELIDDIGYLKSTPSISSKLIENTTANGLYNYYRKIVVNNKPIIFVMGDVDSNEVNNIFKKYFSNIEESIFFEANYNVFLQAKNNDTCYVEEVSKFYQSSLLAAYKVKDMTDDDRIMLRIVSNLLSNKASNLIKRNLRDNSGLTYYADVDTYSHSGVMIISVLIDADKKDEALKQIKKTINDLRNKELIQPLLKNIIKRKKADIERNKDDKFDTFVEELLKHLKTNYTDVDLYNNMKNVSFEDLNKFVDRLQLDTVFFLKGEKNGK
jgi:predicted Zn-dependent peptidase